MHRKLTHPAYRLRRGLVAWELVFEGRAAVLKHERGISCVAALLWNPPAEPIHALDLIALAHEAETAPARPRHYDSGGLSAQCSRIQERALGIEDIVALRDLRRKQRELQAILDDENQTEPVKAEVLRELDLLDTHMKTYARRTEDKAQKEARALRRAIGRLHARLQRATDPAGRPHPVLRPFAEHLRRHLLIPSSRYAGLKSLEARRGRVGCFTYEPPSGLIWHR